MKRGSGSGSSAEESRVDGSKRNLPEDVGLGGCPSGAP